MNSSIASSADRFDSTAAIAFVSDEYEERDSTSRLTAFALNSPVYLVPLPWFHHLPSRQGKYGTKSVHINGNRGLIAIRPRIKKAATVPPRMLQRALSKEDPPQHWLLNKLYLLDRDGI